MIEFKTYEPNNLPKYITDGHPFLAKYPDEFLGWTENPRDYNYYVLYMGQFGDLLPYDSMIYQTILRNNPSKCPIFPNPIEYAEIYQGE